MVLILVVNIIIKTVSDIESEYDKLVSYKLICFITLVIHVFSKCKAVPEVLTKWIILYIKNFTKQKLP